MDSNNYELNLGNRVLGRHLDVNTKEDRIVGTFGDGRSISYSVQWRDGGTRDHLNWYLWLDPGPHTSDSFSSDDEDSDDTDNSDDEDRVLETTDNEK